MADHQTATPPAPPAQTTPPAPDTAVVLPRSQEVAPEQGDPTEKAAREAKERMSKTQGFWNRLSPDKEPKAEKPAEAQPEKPKEEPKAAAPAKEEKKPKGRKKEPEVDPIELARATGQEIAREIAKANAQPKPAPQAPAPTAEGEVELPEEFRRDVDVFEEMARLDPKRYGNIKKDLARYATAESEYIAKWEQEHEGETYDGDSAEHDAFYARIRPNYDQNDFTAAKESLLTNKVASEVTKKVSQEFQQREAEAERRREAAAKIQPELEQEMFSTLGDLLRETDPDNAELAKDFESIKKLEEKNPLLSDVMVYVHNQAKPLVAATMRLFRSVEAFDRNNPAHQRVANVIAFGEQQISRLPIKDRYDHEGRLFATQEDYAKMTPAEQSRHWYVGERETVALLRGQAITQTKEIYGREKQKLERYTGRTNATQPANSPAPKKTETPAQPRPDNGSPSVTGRGTLPGDGQAAATKPTSGRDLFFGRHLSA